MNYKTKDKNERCDSFLNVIFFKYIHSAVKSVKMKKIEIA